MLLKNLSRTESLKISAEKIGISYKTAQNYIGKIEAKINQKIVDSHKGGVGAGGKTVLNNNGYDLIKKYELANEALIKSFKIPFQRKSR